MPSVPKPKRETKAARKKWNAAKPWLQVPSRPVQQEIAHTINLFGEAADDALKGLELEYRIQKARAVAFTRKGLDIPAWAYGVCLNCGTYLKRGREAQAHHWCIRKSAGVQINHWWNLWPLCSEDCHNQIEGASVGASIANEHYLRIARYHLCITGQDDVGVLKHAGRAWIAAEIAELVGDGVLDSRQPYYLPLVEESDDDS